MAAPKPQARALPRSPFLEWCGRHPVLLLGAATVLVLLPFLGKPFNIDDPLFLWAAQHIRAHPLDPYGFNVNWYGFDLPMSGVTQNPPLACYYLAIFGSLFGWSEAVLHGSLLLPAMAVVLGAHRLAGHFCKHPLFVAFLTLFAPVFLISSTTLMCDVLMLAFWTWALIFWIEGTEKKRTGHIAFAAVLMTLAALTKYFGACLLPLVAAWSIAGKRPVKEWLGWLALPLGALVAYQLATRALYGHGLLTGAASYVSAVRKPSVRLYINSIITALSFTGGCVAAVTFFAPLLWSKRGLLIGGIASIAVTGVLLFAIIGTFQVHPGALEIVQVLVWATGGVSLLALTCADLKLKRDTDSLLLTCWVFGTFAFTAFFNWTINGRSLLPLAIPAAILAARRLERAGKEIKWSHLAIPTVAGAGIAIWAATADYFFATAQEVAARAVQTAYGNDTHRLWFQGHWGFQYYMEKNGATALDLQHLQLTEGDHIAMPSGNSNVYPLKEPVTELETFSVPIQGNMTTLNKDTGAGFYASVWGPLPFAFGSSAPQEVTVFAYDPTGEIQKAATQKTK